MITEDVPLEVDFVYEITVEDASSYESLITAVLRRAAAEEGVGGEVVVSVVDDERIRELNREYRGKDSATDVLSFPMLESVEDEPTIVWESEDAEEQHDAGAARSMTYKMDYPGPDLETLGDIVISWSTACRQAEEYGHSREREMAFLALHGLLHLYGYDHETPADEEAMFSKQRMILESMGLDRS